MYAQVLVGIQSAMREAVFLRARATRTAAAIADGCCCVVLVAYDRWRVALGAKADTGLMRKADALAELRGDHVECPVLCYCLQLGSRGDTSE